MFELVLIHQSEEKAGDMQQAWEQPGVRLRAYDAWAMDPEALDDCRQALLQCDFAVILLHGGLSWFPDFQKLSTALSESRRFFFHSEIEEENQLILKKSSLLQEEQDFLRSCFEMGGVENFKKMLVFFQTGERKEPQPKPERQRRPRKGALPRLFPPERPRHPRLTSLRRRLRSRAKRRLRHRRRFSPPRTP